MPTWRPPQPPLQPTLQTILVIGDHIGTVECSAHRTDTLSVFSPDSDGHILILTEDGRTYYLTRETVLALMGHLHTALSSPTPKPFDPGKPSRD